MAKTGSDKAVIAPATRQPTDPRLPTARESTEAARQPTDTRAPTARESTEAARQPTDTRPAASDTRPLPSPPPARAEGDTLEQAAQRGNVSAQKQMARRYWHGQGVRKDASEALRWYRAAALQGDVDAQRSFHSMLSQGYGESPDEVWVAAQQGQVWAQYEVGAIYARGQGVQRNPTEAARWYWTAAEQGYGYAQYILSTAYRSGEGVPRDDAKAIEWLRAAALRGYGKAQSTLAEQFLTGDGAPQNPVEAYAWFSIAASNGQVRAKEQLGALSRELNGRQLSQGDTLAQQYRSMMP